MSTNKKCHKCHRISAEKRERIAKLMLDIPHMRLDYKKGRWEKKMNEKAKEDK
ncbi:hypothetical protein F2Q69_00057392 [Brassica cretica]|uniref:Uncharacterized protein n=1 Tax=Brassica cretica TaxID=69181 RepID=A0A8S9MY29_BRACR|nr:hypothetical protein F2Q69_00057392 [Brassica cretica]